MAVVDIFIGRVSHTAMFHLCPACLQIAVPEFVTKEQEKQIRWVYGTPEPFLVLEATVVKKGLRRGKGSHRERKGLDLREGVTSQGLCFSKGIHSVHLGHIVTCVVTGCRRVGAGEQGSTGRAICTCREAV